MTSDEAAEPAQPADPEPSQERLDDLGESIDRVRNRVEDEAGGTEPLPPETDTNRSFVEPGEEGPVDDTIVPPA